MPAGKKLMRLPGTKKVELDQCMYGLKDPLSEKLYRKKDHTSGKHSWHGGAGAAV